MRVCVYGAGAIGGLIAARLAHGGTEVSCIARGAHLAAMRADGLRLISGDTEIVTRPLCTDDPAQAGPQDYVIVALKAHQAPGVAAAMAPLLGPDTAVAFAVNGIPWWYFHRIGNQYEGLRLNSVDPDGLLWDHIGPRRALGCVVYPAATIVAPGVIVHRGQDRLPIGEPDGTRSARAVALSRALIGAGFKSPVRPRIRDEIWIKLWGNVAFNPISVLTHETLENMATDPGTRKFAHRIMAEVRQVGEAVGARFAISADRRIAGVAATGQHRTSTLEDLEQGRLMEIDALCGAVAETGRLVGVATPNIDAIYALARLRAINAGCYPADSPFILDTEDQ